MHSLEALPSAGSAAAVLACGVACAVAARRLWPAALAAGFFWTCHCAQLAVDARLPADLAGRDIALEGWVEEFPDVGADQTRLTLRITQSERAELIGSRIRLSWYEPPFIPNPADRLRLTVRLRQPHGFVNPNGFDYERWLLLEGIAATGYVRSVHEPVRAERGLAPGLLRIRSQLRERIAQHIDTPRAAALITALSIGERSGFTDLNWETFRRTGTSHLVAISGLHIGIVAFAVYWLIAWVVRTALPWWADSARAVASVAAISAAAGYAALAGFSVSTVRAVIMFAAGLIIVNLRRSVSRAHAFALAVLLVTAFDPLETLGASFWLSFGAVATLMLATCARQLGASAPRLISICRNCVRVQISIVLMSVPATAIFFSEFSAIAFVVNLLAIPAFAFVLVPLTLICVFADLSLSAPAFAWDLAGWLAASVMSLLTGVAQFARAAVIVAPPTAFAAAIAVVGAVLMLAWHPGRLRSIGALTLLPLLWPAQGKLPYAAFRLTVLDVGHGLAGIVETRNHLLVYDTGARFPSGFDIGGDILQPVLRARREPDLLIVSHADNDHIGGAASIIAAYPDVPIIGGRDVELPGTQTCAYGQSWSFDGVTFEILHPQAEFRGSGNDGSCVLRISVPEGSALLAGDIERRAESAVVASGLARTNVVVAPHHGSATSSSPAFVGATAPDIAVFSAGFRNRWNFPVDAVVERWCEAGAEVYVTGEQGAVEIVIGAGPIRANSMRAAERRYWRTNGAPRCGESNTVTL